MRDARAVGVIEGFYGSPWSQAARLSMVRTLGELGLGWYVHAPKNEPHHRDRWDEPHTPLELDAFAELVEESERQLVRLAVALAPQKLFGKRNLRAGATEQLAALVAKVDGLLAVGVRHIVLSFDDTAATFSSWFASQRLGEFHAACARALQRRVLDRAPDGSVALVPAVYWGRYGRLGRRGQAYWAGLGELGLGDRAGRPPVAVAWTGPGIFSRKLRGRDVRELCDAARVPIILWNNLITNDYLPLLTGDAFGRPSLERVSFAPVDNVELTALDEAAGLWLNGAREPEATKISLRCLAELIHRGQDYDGRTAHAHALASLDDGDTGATAAARIYELTCRHPLSAPRRVEAERLRTLVEAHARHEVGAEDGLRAELELLAELPSRLASELRGHPLAAELHPTAQKISLWARYGLLRLAGQHRSDNARAYLRAANRIRWQVDLRILNKIPVGPERSS